MPYHEPIQPTAQGVSETQSGNPPNGQETLDAETKNHLLSIVLRETLNRKRDDPMELLRSLRRWHDGLAAAEFDQSSCEAMVAQVLRYRLGNEAEKFPTEMCQALGEVLWNDPVSQSRLKQLWIALGSSP